LLKFNPHSGECGYDLCRRNFCQTRLMSAARPVRIQTLGRAIVA
jgi:hypothetical protein